MRPAQLRRTHNPNKRTRSSSARHRPQPHSPSHRCLPHSSFISPAHTGETAPPHPHLFLSNLLAFFSVLSPLSCNLFCLSHSCLSICLFWIFLLFLLWPLLLFSLFFFPPLCPHPSSPPPPQLSGPSFRFSTSLLLISTSSSRSPPLPSFPPPCCFSDTRLCAPSPPPFPASLSLSPARSSFHFSLRLSLDGGKGSSPLIAAVPLPWRVLLGTARRCL